MKHLPLFVVALFALTVTSQAVPPPGWSDDYAKAVEKAKTENKNLLLDFTGSDWCGYCMALDKEVFKTPKFKEWAKENVILVQVDFPKMHPLSPRLKKQNDELKSQFKFNGYPTIVVVDTAGKELGRKSGYNPGSGPDAYISGLEGMIKK